MFHYQNDWEFHYLMISLHQQRGLNFRIIRYVEVVQRNTSCVKKDLHDKKHGTACKESGKELT